MNQLDLLKATSARKTFEVINLSDFNPELTGTVRVRTSLTLKETRELQAARDGTDDEAYFRLLAQLIPRDTDNDDVPLSYEELKAFLAGADEDDLTFQTWFTNQIVDRVNAHFLARTPHSGSSATN